MHIELFLKLIYTLHYSICIEPVRVGQTLLQVVQTQTNMQQNYIVRIKLNKLQLNILFNYLGQKPMSGILCEGDPGRTLPSSVIQITVLTDS
jgi:hypothetical protein